MLGGRGRMTLPRSAADWAHLEHAMLRLYPALSGVPIERRWFGRVALTPDHLPHIHEPEKGLIAALGCQGRGLGLMTALGARLAAYLRDGDRKGSALSGVAGPADPVPRLQANRRRRGDRLVPDAGRVGAVSGGGISHSQFHLTLSEL